MAVNHAVFDCPPERVFEVLADGWLYPSWVVGASRMRAVDATWPAPDNAIHHSAGVWPALLDDTTSVLEWDPRTTPCSSPQAGRSATRMSPSTCVNVQGAADASCASPSTPSPARELPARELAAHDGAA